MHHCDNHLHSYINTECSIGFLIFVLSFIIIIIIVIQIIIIIIIIIIITMMFYTAIIKQCYYTLL